MQHERLRALGLDGRRVAAAVKAASPKTPIVLLTGWGYSMRENGDLPSHVDHLLSKPPDVNELRLAISKLTAEAETWAAVRSAPGVSGRQVASQERAATGLDHRCRPTAPHSMGKGANF